MEEINHQPLSNSIPEPAKPILASHLLDLEERQRLRFTTQGGERISTGCPEIDEILEDGIERGIVLGISAEAVEGKLISLHLLTTVLISQLASPPTSRSKSKATVIDTTGSFPLSLFAQVLKSKIRTSRARIPIANDAVHRERQDEEDVQRCLEMVEISRVFDIEGLWEVIREVGGPGLLAHQVEHMPIDDNSPPVGIDDESSLPKSAEIFDSEDDDEELTPDPTPIPIQPLSKAHRGEIENKDDDAGTEIIIIDNMTNIIQELFARKDKGEAYNLLTTLSHTIHTLTHTRNILTILHNTTVPSRPAPDNLPTHYAQDPESPYPTTRHNLPAPSVFQSNAYKPALGQVFARFPDLHLFMSRLPRGRADAEVMYARDAAEMGVDTETVRTCCVVEVVKDETPRLGGGGGENKRKFGYREQRWTAVEVASDGLRLTGAFAAKGTMPGIDLGREHNRREFGGPRV